MAKIHFVFWTACCLLFSFHSTAQTTRATILTKIPISTSQCYTLLVDDNNSKYKSSIHDCTELTSESQIILVSDPNLGSDFWRIEDNNHIVVKRISSESTITLPDSLLADLPILQNEILFFRNNAHAESFYAYLQDWLEKNESEENEYDELLDKFETTYEGYLSYRTFFNFQFISLENDYTELDIDRMEKQDFIKDNLIKTFLNSKRLVGVGDSVYYFHDVNIKLSCHKEDNYALDAIKSIIDSDDIVQPLSIFQDKEHFSLKTPFIITPVPKHTVISGNTKYTSYPQIQNLNCSVYKKMLRVHTDKCTPNQQNNQVWDCTSYFYDQDYLIIDWDDGTIDSIPNYAGQWIEHTYLQTGIYFPKTKVTVGPSIFGPGPFKLLDGMGTPGSIIEFQVGAACTGGDYTFTDAATTAPYKLTCSLWLNENVFGTHIGSYSHAWKKKVTGNYERIRAELYTQIQGNLRNTNCENEVYKEGDKERNNQKKVEKSKTSLFGHLDISNGDVRSKHRMRKNGTTIEKELVLNPC